MADDKSNTENADKSQSETPETPETPETAAEEPVVVEDTQSSDPKTKTDKAESSSEEQVDWIKELFGDMTPHAAKMILIIAGLVIILAFIMSAMALVLAADAQQALDHKHYIKDFHQFYDSYH